MSAEERRIQDLEDELRALKLQHGVGGGGAGGGAGADPLSMVKGRRRGGAANASAVPRGGEYGGGGSAGGGSAEVQTGIAEGGFGWTGLRDTSKAEPHRVFSWFYGN